MDEAIAAEVRRIHEAISVYEEKVAWTGLALTDPDYVHRLHWVQEPIRWGRAHYPRSLACWIVPLEEQVR